MRKLVANSLSKSNKVLMFRKLEKISEEKSRSPMSPFGVNALRPCLLSSKFTTDFGFLQ